jgi:hypothetical protein
MDEWTHATKMHHIVYNTYLKCPIQLRAVKSALLYMENTKLVWAHVDDKGEEHALAVPVSSKEHTIWRNFVAEIIIQLKIFGFAVYRVSRTRHTKRRAHEFRGEHTNLQREYSRMEVANGQGVLLNWNPKQGWDVHSINGTAMDDKSHGWNLEILNEPYKYGPNNIPILNSAAANCQKDSEDLLKLNENIAMRDTINSKPMVFTSVSKHLVTSDGSTRPWFVNPTNVHGNTHLDIPGAGGDFNSMLAGRLETIKRLNSMSKKAREDARKGFEIMQRPGRPAEIKKPNRHDPDEMFVTDGRDYTQMHYLQGPNDQQHLLSRMEKSIQYAHQTPPSWYGVSGGNERLTSNDRLAQKSLVDTELYMKSLMAAAQGPLTKMSRAIGKEDAEVRMKPCISAYNLSQIEGFLKEDVALEAHACIHQLPVSAFDKKAYKEHRKIILYGEQSLNQEAKAKAAGDVDGGGSNARPKPRMSEKDKKSRRDEKAKV